ncbi:MAG: hypothetical protein QOJ10_538 [Chloroflexota bacterium]|nr:hypothetical protein [Chloroflexota bacterium]
MLDEHARVDALRAWLANGIHIFGVDPRRRRGRQGYARQALAEDIPQGHASSGALQSLASALHRHTVRGGMSELTPEERRVITLAYLEGHTNQEIAAMLGVSVSTVRRRLWVALKRLDQYISRTGTWLSAILLLGIGYVVDRATQVGRWASADWSHKIASTVAVGAISVTAIGLTAFSSDSSRPHAAAAAGLASSLGVGERMVPMQATNVHPGHFTKTLVGDRSQSGRPTVGVIPLVDLTESETSDDSDNSNRGCQGNPTSAPPQVPVGPPINRPPGSPVTHPTAGGCRA